MIVSNSDIDLMDFNWYINNEYYARTVGPKGSVRHTQYMHRVILERMLSRPLKKGETVDHIDGNKLNNQRSNLRLATQSENNYNVGKRSNNTSGYKGVTWHKSDQRWQAQLMVDKTYKYLGQFDTPEEAYEAYKAAALELHGEFARLGMSILNMPQHTSTVMAAIGKHEQNGETVVQVTVSPNLHMALIEEAWLYAGEAIDEINSISMIPVETSSDLTHKHFEIITAKGSYRND